MWGKKYFCTSTGVVTKLTLWRLFLAGGVYGGGGGKKGVRKKTLSIELNVSLVVGLREEVCTGPLLSSFYFCWRKNRSRIY